MAIWQRTTTTALLAMVVAQVFSGCALLRVGPAVQVHEVHTADHAKKNLEAIRSLQADRRGERALDRDRATAHNADENVSFSAPEPSTAIERPLNGRAAVRSMTPSSTPTRPGSDGTARLPWTPPTVSRPALPDRPVPAYTIPAPVGPDHGSTRCVPDGNAGQRCLR